MSKSAICLYFAIVLCWTSLYALHSRRLADDPQNTLSVEAFLPVSQDAINYANIVRNGYKYYEDKRSMVAFFPLYPMLAKPLCALGMPVYDSLLLVSQLCHLAACLVLCRYARSVQPDDAATTQGVLLVFLLYPMHFFFFSAYSEPLFFLIVTVFCLGMRENWSVISLAVLAGLASACRPVGFLLSVPWLLHAYPRVGLGKLLLLLPISVSGLLAYMLYLYLAFEDPLVFIKAQDHWQVLQPNAWEWPKWKSLLSLEPVWRAFDSTHSRYVFRGADPQNPLAAPKLIHILLWLSAGGLWLFACGKRLITGPEAALWFLLWLFPYITRAYEMAMHSQGRFVSVIPPMYIVLALGIRGWPGSARLILAATAGLCQLMLLQKFALGKGVF